jgi:hypothetical protein
MKGMAVILTLILCSLSALGCGVAMAKDVSPERRVAAYGGAAPAPVPASMKQANVDVDHDGIKDEMDVAPNSGADDLRLAQNTTPSTGGAGGQPPSGSTQQPAQPVAKDAATPQLLIYTADVTIAVFQVDQQMNAVEQVAHAVGGYLSSRSDQQVVIRVPREKFDEAIHKIEALGDVLHRSIAAQDVTDQYVDLQARLKNAYVMRERLTALLKDAQVKDALEIEKELGRVTESIEQMEGQLKLLSDRVAYSTISVSFQAVNPQGVPDTQFTLPFPWIQDLGLSSLLSVHQ